MDADTETQRTTRLRALCIVAILQRLFLFLSAILPQKRQLSSQFATRLMHNCPKRFIPG